MLTFSAGMTVHCRGERFQVISSEMLLHQIDGSAWKLQLRGLDGDLRGQVISVIHPIDHVEADGSRELDLSSIGRMARFRLLHQAYLLEMAPPGDVLVSAVRTRVNFEPYQYVPALRALSLPRPRLLLADDVGLGKTIEAGILLRELTVRRRANRVLIVCPAGIQKQWRDELRNRFGFHFSILDSEGVREKRRALDFDANPWSSESRVIASVDYIKRRDGEFQSLSASRWDVVVVDEAHHLAANRNEDDITDRHRLARWLSEATDALFLLSATPHDGYDESLSSLLELLEPSLVLPGAELHYPRYEKYVVRRLKRHIVTSDGKPKFVPRAPVRDIPVTLTNAELSLHRAVMAEASKLDEIAEKASRIDREAIKLVATVLRKRAASSRKALSTTISNRLENLGAKSEQVELRREHIRALRRGEVLADPDLALLERDAHRNLLSVLRGEGAHLRRIESEETALRDLQSLVGACSNTIDSKLIAIENELKSLHAESPSDKVIVFSEFTDTVSAIEEHLLANGYANRLVVLTGDTQPAKREEVIRTFNSDPNILILLANDVAGEGLNLQERCHRMIHFDLPYNPNRLEQRNGRIDRYGQKQTPFISFLYAKDTYDGEVLKRLTIKIENQIRTLGSVGDVLGRIQQEQIDRLLAECPVDMLRAVEAAERQIDEEINRGSGSNLAEKLGSGSSDANEVKSADAAASSGSKITIPADQIVELTVKAAGGRVARTGTCLSVTTPIEWTGGDVLSDYVGLLAPGDAQSPDIHPDIVLHDEHPLVGAAIRWVKSTQYTEDNHRLAYQVADDIGTPEVLATFVVTLRDGEGEETQRIEIVRVNSDLNLTIPNEADIEIIGRQSLGNVDLPRVVAIFGEWWQKAQDLALDEAKRRVGSWRQSTVALRGLEQVKLLDELNAWDRATVQSIISRYAEEYNQPTLFGKPEDALPPAVRRRLRDHLQRARERTECLRRRVEFDEPVVEPLGVLLRIPQEVVS